MQRDEDGAQTPSILSFPLGTCAPSENQREFGDGFVKATTGPRRKEAHAALAAVLFFFFFFFLPFSNKTERVIIFAHGAGRESCRKVAVYFISEPPAALSFRERGCWSGGPPRPVGYRFTPPLPAQVNPHKPACVMENPSAPQPPLPRKHSPRFSFPPPGLSKAPSF